MKHVLCAVLPGATLVLMAVTLFGVGKSPPPPPKTVFVPAPLPATPEPQPVYTPPPPREIYVWGVTDVGYEYLEEGMPLWEVEKMLGGRGKEIASNGPVKMYNWEARFQNGRRYDYGLIGLTFINGRLESKVRSGTLPAM